MNAMKRSTTSAAVLRVLALVLLLGLMTANSRAFRVSGAYQIEKLTPTAFLYMALIKNRPGIGDADHLLITEVLFDPDSAQGDVEWMEIFNPTGDVHDLHPYKIGDEETLGGSEGLLQFPQGASIGVGETIVIAEDAGLFASAFGFEPDFEFSDSGSPVPDMVKYTAWAGGNVALTNSGDEVLLIDIYDDLVDAVSWGSSNWAFNPDVPVVAKGHSIERFPGYIDSDSAEDWRDQPAPSPGRVDLTPPTPVPTASPSPTAGPSPTPLSGWILLSEVLFDPTGTEPAAEWVEIHNIFPMGIDLSGTKIGDEESVGGSEGMFEFPVGSWIDPGGLVVVANDGTVFFNTYGFEPDFELTDSSPNIPNMVKYTAWSGGNMSLGNSGDEVLLLSPGDVVMDAVSWGSSSWAFSPPVPGVTAGSSIERYPPGLDTNSAADWREQPQPGPGQISYPLSTPEP